MEIYNQLHSTLTLDGKNYLVDLPTWARLRLVGEQLDSYLQEEPEFSGFFSSSPEYTNESIYSSAKTANDQNIIIGIKHKFLNTRLSTPRYEYWENQFANDPAVIYRPPVKES
jgi:hypothetical protein